MDAEAVASITTIAHCLEDHFDIVPNICVVSSQFHDTSPQSWQDHRSGNGGFREHCMYLHSSGHM
jgi:hypothetical protein